MGLICKFCGVLEFGKWFDKIRIYELIEMLEWTIPGTDHDIFACTSAIGASWGPLNGSLAWSILLLGLNNSPMLFPDQFTVALVSLTLLLALGLPWLINCPLLLQAQSCPQIKCSNLTQPGSPLGWCQARDNSEKLWLRFLHGAYPLPSLVARCVSCIKK